MLQNKLKTCDLSGENIDQFENDDDEVFITTNCGRASTMVFECNMLQQHIDEAFDICYEIICVLYNF